MNFDAAFDRLIGLEGDYSNDSRDPGGSTRWGVTQRVAIQEGYTGDMHVYPKDAAKAVYRTRYWNAIHADELPEALRYSLFDASVNSGVKQAVKWLQQTLDVVDDGVMGPMTLAAAQRTDGLKLAVGLNAERLDFMTSLPTWAAFGKGWARRVASNLKTL